MVDVENRRKAILVLKSRMPPVVQMFALAQDWFMVFTALVPLVIFTAEHVYSGNPGDRFSAQGVISHNKRVIYNWYKAVWVYVKHGVYSKQYSLAKRADKISYYLVFMTYVGCFSSKSMVSTWIVSYLLVYTWHTPLHYPHAANAGCVLAGGAPVVTRMTKELHRMLIMYHTDFTNISGMSSFGHSTDCYMLCRHSVYSKCSAVVTLVK